MRSAPGIGLIALDIDGTLVGEDGIVRPRVKHAIARAQAVGVRFTLVTGRMFAAAQPFAASIGVDGPIVCYQGAGIYDAQSGKALRETPVDQSVTREVLQWAHDNGVHAQCYADDTLFVESINKYSKMYTDLTRVEAHVIPDLRAAFHDRPSIKIVMVEEPADALRHLAELTERFGDRAYLTRSNAAFVEVLSPQVDKGKALRFIAERDGVTMDRTMAMGDAWNDVPLLEAAAVGIAMGSGPPELFACATHVVGDVAHDGVAEAIETYVLA
jgi:Cof subfamily protein (haloacid dehalogenase superfamily)